MYISYSLLGRQMYYLIVFKGHRPLIINKWIYSIHIVLGALGARDRSHYLFLFAHPPLLLRVKMVFGLQTYLLSLSAFFPHVLLLLYTYVLYIFLNPPRARVIVARAGFVLVSIGIVYYALRT